MKKIITFTLIVCLAAMLFACTPAPADSGGKETATPDISQQPTDTPVLSPETSVETSESAEVSSETPTATNPNMYSSYAHLVSFDPATGIAQFDYFDMLTGNEAVQFLVEHEGYTQAEAQEEVDNYADSEFIEKNENPQLRAIDLKDLSLSLMYQPSGAEVTDATPVPSTYSDFLAIWTLNPVLLRDHYFYYIHVNANGDVYHVEQVFWP